MSEQCDLINAPVGVRYLITQAYIIIPPQCRGQTRPTAGEAVQCFPSFSLFVWSEVYLLNTIHFMPKVGLLILLWTFLSHS